MDSPARVQRQLKTIRLVYYSLIGSLVIFTSVVYYLIKSGSMGPPDYSLAIFFQTAAVILVPALMAAGYFLFKYSLPRIKPGLSLSKKIGQYFALILMRSALLEASFLFCCAAALITKEVLFLSITPFIFFIFVLLRPTTEGIAADLKLNDGEKEKLEEK